MAWHILYLTCRTAGPLNSYVTCKIGMYDLVNTVSWLLVTCWYLVGRQLADRLPTAERGSYRSLLLCFRFVFHVSSFVSAFVFRNCVTCFVPVFEILCLWYKYCVTVLGFVFHVSSLCYCFIFCICVLNFVLVFQDLWFSFVPTGHHRSYSCCILRFVEGRNLHTLETIWHFMAMAMFLLLLPKEAQKWTVMVWNSNLIPSYTCF